MINKQRKSIYPEYEHIQLLKACLLKGDSAIGAWEKWDKVIDINDIDNASMRLLPSLYPLLRDNKLYPKYYNKIKGVYRRTIVKNKLLLKAFNEILDQFTDKGINLILLKGGALIIGKYYDDPYKRPMSDIDILIKPTDKIIAKKILIENGWNELYREMKYYKPIIGRKNYYKQPNMEIDLHWYLLYEFPNSNIDNYLWQTAKIVEYKNKNILILNSTFLLMHACIHGARWSGSYPLRWIQDAILILKSSDNINWTEIISQTIKRRLTLPMFKALTIIDNIFPKLIPTQAILELKENHKLSEYLWYGLAKKELKTKFKKFLNHYFEYLVFYRKKFQFPSLFRYFQSIYNTKSLMKLPYTLFIKSINRSR